jgi:luciferase family oxidoreductase group 1
MLSAMIALSILDLAPIPRGSDAAQALRRSRDLAQHAERWGYQRFWLAEHHGMPGIASAATAVVMAFVAEGTRSIRVGAGGIMLPNHAPLLIAEQFGTLECLYPGRIDLGLGRAPGSDQATARALRRTLLSDPEQFPQDVLELMAYFDPPASGSQVRAVPGQGLKIPLWILGSSLFGAQTAASLGLPYAFASHFAPAQMLQAIEVYRRNFRPSAQLQRPYVMLGFNVFAADSEAEARLLASSLHQAFVNLHMGRPSQLPPPQADFLEQLPAAARLRLEHTLSCSAIGNPDQVRAALRAFIQRTGADELMITTQVFDHAARLRSFEIAAQVSQS